LPVARTLVCVILFATCTVAVGGDRSLNIALQTKGMSTYYVPVDIAGWGLVDMLVDTGSSYSTISQSALDRLAHNAHQVFVEGESYRERLAPGAPPRRGKSATTINGSNRNKKKR